MDLKFFEKTAADVRVGVIKAVSAAGSGHPGGSLSAADIVTALYFKEMNIDPDDPKKKDRDKFILSKGHAGPVQYAALALRGFFPKENVLELRKLGGKFRVLKCPQAHLVRDLRFPQVWRWQISLTAIRAECMF